MSQNIWNPWHGCTKKSEGCENCYMYYLDTLKDRDGSVFHVNKTTLNAPLARNRQKNFKIPSGSKLRVCMTSDFFLEDADPYRQQVWDIMKQRPDVIFYLLTKRPERFEQCLPDDWGLGYENVQLCVTAENQKRADERLPILIRTAAKHKGVNVAPFIGPVSLAEYLVQDPAIEEVEMGGENYEGCRPLYNEWVNWLFNECVAANVRCHLYETGTNYVLNNQTFTIMSKSRQSAEARSLPYRFMGRTPVYRLLKPDGSGRLLTWDDIPMPTFTVHCQSCPTLEACTGCTGCGHCGYDRTICFPDMPRPYKLAEN